ncbi:MAG: hypothetical protein R3D99_08150 [Altererythrobacter sp.]
MRIFSALLGLFAVLALPGCSDGTASDSGKSFFSFGSPDYVAPPVQPRSTWAKHVIPDGKIPETGFLAAYFDRRGNPPAVNTEEVDNVAIKYAWDELHHIASENFGGYWIGQLDMPEGGKRTISVSLSHAKARILIDGRLVHTTERDSQFTHMFAPGRHLIEVEHINNWHTTEFKVTIGEVEPAPVSDSELRSALAKSGNGEIFYVGLYESDARDTSVEVNLPRTGKTAIVWLDSYEAIDWTLDAPDGVEAAIITSYSPGSRIVDPAGTRVYRTEQRLDGRKGGDSGSCRCISGRFHCEKSAGLGGLSSAISRRTGKALAGYAMTYSAAEVSIRDYDKSAQDEAKAAAARTEEARRMCESHANPDFDRMFD